MEWKIFLATFGAVFFAEFADKTQLVGMGMASKTGKPLSVWLGSISAYIIVTAISVLLGVALGKHIKPEIVRYVSAFLFVIIGVLIFWGKI